MFEKSNVHSKIKSLCMCALFFGNSSHNTALQHSYIKNPATLRKNQITSLENL